MIKLSKFYELVPRYAVVQVIHSELQDTVYFGMLKDIPDELDNCEVKDFETSTDVEFIFWIA